MVDSLSTMTSSCMTSSKILSLVDEMESHRNIRMWTAPLDRRENISAINELKWSKAAGHGNLTSELFIAPSAVCVDLLLPFERREGDGH